MAGPLARAWQSARLADELQRSRRLVVLAAEEERRRLRRDLHDGLGPVLAGAAYTADAARNVLDARLGRAAWVPGVGPTSMRERLEQLGGVLEAGATPAGGRVHARLPLVAPSAAGADD